VGLRVKQAWEQARSIQGRCNVVVVVVVVVRVWKRRVDKWR
jgi:hypothetical protein